MPGMRSRARWMACDLHFHVLGPIERYPARDPATRSRILTDNPAKLFGFQFAMATETPESARKAQIDALLLKLPGVSAKKISNLDAYFVNDRMFACISGRGIGLRLPAATATELQFSRDNVVPFQPGGMASSREWIQIDRAEAADYEKDLPLFQASLDYVRAARGR